VGHDDSSGPDGIVQGDVERPRAQEVRQVVGFLGADYHVHTQSPSGIEEISRPVGGRRNEEE
jgi:hypothetical protein